MRARRGIGAIGPSPAISVLRLRTPPTARLLFRPLVAGDTLSTFPKSAATEGQAFGCKLESG